MFIGIFSYPPPSASASTSRKVACGFHPLNPSIDSNVDAVQDETRSSHVTPACDAADKPFPTSARAYPTPPVHVNKIADSGPHQDACPSEKG
eukprot:9441698-Pyramimonas_sp.AAC.1